MFLKKKQEQPKSSRVKNLMNIATILTVTLAVLKALYYNFISIKIAAVVLVGLAIILAIKSPIAKIAATLIAAYVFFVNSSEGNSDIIIGSIGAFLALTLAVVGIYIAVGGRLK